MARWHVVISFTVVPTSSATTTDSIASNALDLLIFAIHSRYMARHEVDVDVVFAKMRRG